MRITGRRWRRLRSPVASRRAIPDNATTADAWLGRQGDHLKGAARMLAKTRSCAVVGLKGALVEVEVDIAHGLPSFAIVGLPDAAVNEAKERVRAAIKNSGAIFPLKRIIVNLAPADLRKAGPAYDLPIAVGILLATEQIAPFSATGPVAEVEGALFLGELSLDGGLRHTHGFCRWWRTGALA
ncbi:MAG TPA: magnesium chelatase domain-containing protein [Ktedonobacterales bacterium]